MKGKFITIYGINNIGKSTQAKILVENLEKAGHRAKYVKYPIYDLEPSGPIINKILRSADGQKVSEDELQLWFVLNRYQFEPELKKWLTEGYTVVAEDYVGTGIAWGTAKGLDQSWLEEVNKFLVREDLAILFEGERDLRAQEENHVHENNGELIEKCKVVLEQLAGKLGWKRFKVQPTIEESAQQLEKLVLDYLSEAK